MSTGYQNVPQNIYNEVLLSNAVARLNVPRGSAVYSELDQEAIKYFKWAIDYIEPLKIRLVMKDRNDYDPDMTKKNLIYYDMFDAENNDTQKNNVLLRRANMDNSNDTAGTWSFMVDDHEKNLDETKVGHNNIFILQGKKLRNDPWINMMFGICRDDEHDIYGSVGNNVTYAGFGSAIIANEILLDFKRIASRSGISSSSPYRQDTRMFAPNLFYDAFTADDVYPTKPSNKFPNARDRGLYDMSKINFNIREFIAGLNAPLVILSRLLSDIANLIGASWWVNEYNAPILDFISNRPSGHIVKRYPMSSDNPDLVSYFFNKWKIGRTTKISAGFANKLWSNVDVIDVQSTGGSSAGGSVPLFNRDLAQKLPQGIILRDISLLLQRNGNGTSDPNNVTTLHGHIVKDAGGLPVGKVVAFFDIPLALIPTDRPTPVFIPNLEMQRNVTVAPSDFLWIIIYDRGANIDHTLLWFRGKETTGTNAVRSVAQTGGNHASNDGWSRNDDSWVFAYAAFNRSIQRVNAYDWFSIKQYGLVEQAVNVPLANDPATVDKYLHQMLIYTAKPKLSMGDILVSIPNQPLKPRINIEIQDDRIGFSNNRSLIMENNSVSYEWDASSDASGTQFCGIQPHGLFDFRQQFFRRSSKIFKCCENCN